MSASFSGIRRIYFEMPVVGDDRRWNVMETRLGRFFEVLVTKETKINFSLSFLPFLLVQTNFFTVSRVILHYKMY